MEEEKKIPNNTKTSEHIKKISQKLRDKQYLCDVDSEAGGIDD